MVVTLLGRRRTVPLRPAPVALHPSMAMVPSAQSSLLPHPRTPPTGSAAPWTPPSCTQQRAATYRMPPPPPLPTLPTLRRFGCAMDPPSRAQWAAHWSRHLAPGALLVTLVFPIMPDADPNVGPPFPISPQLYRELLEPHGG